MILRSEIIINPASSQINLKDPVLLAGSCFSENIGSLLSSSKFNVFINPFGILYNPYSIFNQVMKATGKNIQVHEEEIIYNQGIYRSLGFHSAVSSQDKPGLIEKTKKAILDTAEFLKPCKWLILTPGTSIVYVYKKTGSIVANCHKLPRENFQRRFLQVEEILAEFEKMFSTIRELNPELRIILTVSPVRHLNEGFEDNQVSKSILRLACDHIIRRFPEVTYFPAYEIFMDDLRDYRFYAEDLVHPNSLAVQYTWEKFSEAYFDNETRDFVQAWWKVLKALNHRPFNPGTAEYRDFISKTIEKLKSFGNRVNVDSEIKKLNDQL